MQSTALHNKQCVIPAGCEGKGTSIVPLAAFGFLPAAPAETEAALNCCACAKRRSTAMASVATQTMTD